MTVLTLASALVGVVGWSGNPLTLPFVMIFPALWSSAGSRAGAALIATAYFLGASHGLPEGISIFFGSDIALGLVLWAAASLVFTSVHAFCWSVRSGWHRPCRYLLANILMSVPPFGIVGWANPITATGILFPGWGWWGLALSIALLLTVTTKARYAAVAIIGVLAFWSVWTWTEPSNPVGWIGVDTSFLSGREQYADYAQQRATIELVRAGAMVGAEVVVLPESAFGIWTSTTAALWSNSLADLDARVIGGAVILKKDGYENVMIVVTSDSSNVLYEQRMPVPVSMWQPWTTDGAGADFYRNAIVEIDDVRLAILLCYEQLLVWPILHSMLLNPEIMVATGNGWWTGSTNILPIQKAATSSWARLFGLPVAMALNAP